MNEFAFVRTRSRTFALCSRTQGLPKVHCAWIARAGRTTRTVDGSTATAR
jgi:hypothetical protein